MICSKMELYYTLNYSYHKIYTTKTNRLQFPMMIIHHTFEHIQEKISNLKLCEGQQDINGIKYHNRTSQPENKHKKQYCIYFKHTCTNITLQSLHTHKHAPPPPPHIVDTIQHPYVEIIMLAPFMLAVL